jgi:hypothetical protein
LNETGCQDAENERAQKNEIINPTQDRAMTSIATSQKNEIINPTQDRAITSINPTTPKNADINPTQDPAIRKMDEAAQKIDLLIKGGEEEDQKTREAAASAESEEVSPRIEAIW